MKNRIKGLLTGLAVAGMAMAMLIPMVVSADYSTEQCERCCYLYNVQKWYRVSYFDTNHAWVTERVDAWTAREAAEKLGLDAAENCWVGYEGTDFEVILKSYRVSFLDNGVWTTQLVDAVSREDAAKQLGLSAGYDCWVGRVF